MVYFSRDRCRNQLKQVNFIVKDYSVIFWLPFVTSTCKFLTVLQQYSHGIVG